MAVEIRSDSFRPDVQDAGTLQPSALQLATKLRVPACSPDYLARPRLMTRLKAGLRRKLTLISAGAGYGKTTLLAQWTASESRRMVAWLTLDASDNDPVRFQLYLTASIRLAAQAVLKHADGMLAAGLGRAGDAAVPGLVSDLAELGRPMVLVLDDYQFIDASEVHAALAKFLESLPGNVRVILSTRADPPLPLARYRARGELSEIRAEDLQFTLEETDELLRLVHGLKLSREQVVAIDRRTEGWVAALQLAAVSLSDDADTARAVDRLAKQGRWIGDFLVEEVLQRLPEATQDLLLRAVVLEEVTGAACDALLRRKGSAAILDGLWRHGLPMQPLGGEGEGYRFHPLFSDLLRRRLRLRLPEEGVARLHVRASDWYAAQGNPEKAIDHALAARAWEKAAVLIELHGLPLALTRETSLVEGWLKALPEELVRSRAQLSVVYAWMLLRVRPEVPEQVELWLRTAEETMGGVRSHDERELAEARIATIRALVAGLDPADAAEAARLSVIARGMAPATHLRMRAAISNNLGRSYLRLGKLQPAEHAYAEARRLAESGGAVYNALRANYAEAMIAFHRGRMSKAQLICQHALEWLGAELPVSCCIPAAGMIRLVQGLVELEQNQLDTAARTLAEGQELLRLSSDRAMLVRTAVATFRLALARGDEEAADTALLEVGLKATGSTALARALRARLRLRQAARDRDQLAEAVRWADAHPPEPCWETRLPPLTPEGEWQHSIHLSWLRVRIAQQRASGGIDLEPELERMERLRFKAAEAGLDYRQMEMHILDALGRQALGQTPRALAALERALELASGEGLVRLFLDEGKPMMELLQMMRDQGRQAGYATRLLEAAGAPAAVSAPTPANETLSERELQVLKLLELGLSNAEVAQRLVVAASTVKVHTHRIYSKLGVNSRSKAVAKARATGLLAGD